MSEGRLRYKGQSAETREPQAEREREREEEEREPENSATESIEAAVDREQS